MSIICSDNRFIVCLSYRFKESTIIYIAINHLDIFKQFFNCFRRFSVKTAKITPDKNEVFRRLTGKFLYCGIWVYCAFHFQIVHNLICFRIEFRKAMKSQSCKVKSQPTVTAFFSKVTIISSDEICFSVVNTKANESTSLQEDRLLLNTH